MPKATSYNQAGISANREDFTDKLTILSPEETPILSLIPKGKKPGNALREWQVDNLDAPKFDGVLEGADATSFANKAAARVRLANRVQKFRREWAVTDIQEASDQAGLSSEVAYAKSKSLRELKTDIESAISSDQDTQADDGVNPYKLRGLGEWIKATAQSDLAVPAAYRTPAASIDTNTSVTEAQFNAVFQSIYETVGKSGSFKLVAGPTLKSTISNYTRSEGITTASRYNVNENATTKQITLTVDVYVGDFHRVEIIPSLFLGRTSGSGALTAAMKKRGYVINTDLLYVSYMIPPGSKTLENQGGGERGFTDTVLTLECLNPKGFGKFSPAS